MPNWEPDQWFMRADGKGFILAHQNEGSLTAWSIMESSQDNPTDVVLHPLGLDEDEARQAWAQLRECALAMGPLTDDSAT
ncbi:hypothetical protein AB0K92_16235 [Streptomyces sp. NPDC052687]|uniref:hypothetical protein n=1 Tax=Streptomyces sp. NPDC052687 TaxID=3154759 RepID=UPI0034305BBE